MKMAKLLYIFLILLLFSASGFAQTLEDDSWKVYDDSEIAEVRIIIEPEYLNYILDIANAKSDSLFPATFIFKNAAIPYDTVANVGFRERGNTSRGAQKPSFKIDINHFVSGRQFYRLEKLNINGERNDPSIIRSKLCWDMYNQIDIPASRANHVMLYINDEYRGLYINVEHIDDEFVQKRFGSQNGNLYKCLYPADLVYLGPDQESYKQIYGDRKAYDLKTNQEADDYSDLVHFIDVLNNTPDEKFVQEIEKVFNVDNFLKWLALNVLFGSWDDYWYLKNNYYLYHNPISDKFEFIPYDYDNTYGIDWVGGDWGTRNIYQWGNMWEDRPLVTRFLNVPEYRNRYTQHLYDFMEQKFAYATQYPRILSLKNKITPAAEADIYRTLDFGFTTDDFHNSYNQSLTIHTNHVPYGIFPYIQIRISTATSQLNFVNESPTITDVTHIPDLPQPSDAVIITAAIADEGQVSKTTLYYRTPGSGFQSLLMYDDGEHNDGAPNDNNFGTEIPPQPDGTIVYYYIRAVDDQTASAISPVSAPNNAYFFRTHLSSATDVNVKFHFKKALPVSDAGVGLLGAFNDWNKIYPMSLVAENLWEVTVPLSPGSYIYKFVTYQNLDGTSGVIEWIADPENPQTDGDPYYNAVIDVSDPMIYYIKPLAGDTLETLLPEINAEFASSKNFPINSSAILLKIDDLAVSDAANYYDAVQKKLSYLPVNPVMPGEHTLFLSVQNSHGDYVENESLFYINRPLLFLNEFMAINDNSVTDDFGEYGDWVEIYNGDTQPIQLGGMYLTDNLANPQKWMLPEVTIEAGEFLLIWTDGDVDQGELHASFKLSGSGEQLGVFASDQMGNFLIDTLSFGVQSADVSYGRYPDGSFDWFFFSSPTPGTANIAPGNLTPKISEVSQAPATPTETDSVWITAHIIDDSGIAEANLHYFTESAPATIQAMFDDGLHHDGAAEDNIFGCFIQPFADGTEVSYYLSAEDDASAIVYSPPSAPDSVYSYIVGYKIPKLVINELLADNDDINTDEAGDYDDWIELFNYGDSPVSLFGMFMTDDLDEPTKWQFPDTTIAALGYLLIWADDEGDQGSLHANFKLGKDGEQVGLYTNDKIVVDTLTFTTQITDSSYGRFPDGADDWYFMYPTPNAANKITTKLTTEQQIVPTTYELWQNYPNPFNPETTIKFALPEATNVSINIYNISGQLIKTLVEKEVSAGYHTLTWRGESDSGRRVASGLYFYQIKTDKFAAIRKMMFIQ